LKKKKQKFKAAKKMAKNYSFATSGQTRPEVFTIIICVLGSNNTRLLSAAQKDAALRNFFNAIFSRPNNGLRLLYNLVIPHFSEEVTRRIAHQ
jgi:hypothetical protein